MVLSSPTAIWAAPSPLPQHDGATGDSRPGSGHQTWRSSLPCPWDLRYQGCSSRGSVGSMGRRQVMFSNGGGPGTLTWGQTILNWFEFKQMHLQKCDRQSCYRNKHGESLVARGPPDRQAQLTTDTRFTSSLVPPILSWGSCLQYSIE